MLVAGCSLGIAAMSGIQPSDDQIISPGVLLKIMNLFLKEMDLLVFKFDCGLQLRLLPLGPSDKLAA